MSRLQQKADRRKKTIHFELRISKELDKAISINAEILHRSKNSEIISVLSDFYGVHEVLTVQEKCKK